MAIAGETLDALEQALTEEKGALLEDQPPVLRVMRRKPHPVPTRTRRRVRIVPPASGAAKPVLRRLDSAGPEAG